jgi:hypothetical protein
MAERKRRGTVIHSWDEVPPFKSEDEEADWWATHSLGDELLNQMKPVPLSADEKAYRRSRTRPIGVRFDESTLTRLKILAERRHKGYQSLLKEFIVERLYEEEKREGLVRTEAPGHRMLAQDEATRRGRPDSVLTATGPNERVRGRTVEGRKRGSLYSRRTSANVRGRRKPGL